MPKTTADYLTEARRIARQAGLFFTEKAEGFVLYRKTPTRPVCLGRRTSAAALCSLVKRCATVQ